MLKIKSAIGNYPVMNIISPFTNDQILQGKKCKLNEWRYPPDVDKWDQDKLATLTRGKRGQESPSKLGGNEFSLNIDKVEESGINKEPGEEGKEEEKGEEEEEDTTI